MVVKDGWDPRPAAQTAKRHFLNWLETSSKPCLCLPFCTASFQLACCVLHAASSPDCQTSLSETDKKLSPNLQFACLPALLAAILLASSCSRLSSCTAPVKAPFRKAKAPWQSFLLPLAHLVPPSLTRFPCFQYIYIYIYTLYIYIYTHTHIYINRQTYYTCTFRTKWHSIEKICRVTLNDVKVTAA